MLRKKSDLPQKICVACGRPFSWRKKWARDWEQVKYCSDRCRGMGGKAAPAPSPDMPASPPRRRG